MRDNVLTESRKISIFHGRPLSVLRDDVDASFPIYRSEMKLDDTRTSVARAEASIKLIHFLEDLFRDVYVLISSVYMTKTNLLIGATFGTATNNRFPRLYLTS